MRRRRKPLRRWQEQTQHHDEKALAAAALSPRAFRTYLSDPNASVATQQRFVVLNDSSHHRIHRAHGGKRHNLQRWGRVLLDAIYEDDAELLEDALAMPLARSDARICGGLRGAPFSFGGEAVVSVDQIASQRAQLVAGARDMANATRRFYSEREWANIEQHLGAIADFYPPGVARFQHLELGDTALLVAVRHGSLGAAGRLLEFGCDPLARNERGESVAALLRARYDAYAAGQVLTRNVAGDRVAKKHRQNRQRERRAAIHGFAAAVRRRLEDYDEAVIEPVAHDRWRASVEGGQLPPASLLILDQRPRARTDLAVLRQIEKDTVQLGEPRQQALSVRALFVRKPTTTTTTANALLTIGGDCYGTNSRSLAKLTSEALTALEEEGEKKDGLDPDHRTPRSSLSSLSEGFYDNVDLEQWLADLDHAALLVQSAWRSYWTRASIVRAVHTAAASQLQARARGFLHRRHSRHSRRR
ncbi:hypothetical protein CTAYLR_009172 [Chrysophaeum taylorii]|uniref:Uncharacterized protein n=1 Tax=Chrysophaeum taylorii TaxID=2483200 RepID=A0AAD7UIB6_9STRA|nr:hypothetical protein CTAYLR_009172 [Chrysophaeum taylorii]